MVNAVVWERTAERQKRVLLESRLLAIDGRIEQVDGVQHLIVRRLENADALLAGIDVRSRDFR